MALKTSSKELAMFKRILVGLQRVVMGSDAEEIVRQSPVPVLLVRGKATRKR